MSQSKLFNFLKRSQEALMNNSTGEAVPSKKKKIEDNKKK